MSPSINHQGQLRPHQLIILAAFEPITASQAGTNRTEVEDLLVLLKLLAVHDTAPSAAPLVADNDG